jgi:hypothetical protein
VVVAEDVVPQITEEQAVVAVVVCVQAHHSLHLQELHTL